MSARLEYLQIKEQEQALLDSLIKQNQIRISELPEVNSYVRKTLLNWIGKCMASPDRMGKTESGRVFTLRQVSNRRIILKSEDGNLEMPDYLLIFAELVEAAR